MSDTRNLAIFLNGSAATMRNNATQWGFFNKLSSRAMHDTEININQLSAHLIQNEQQFVLALDGPGTEITRNGYLPIKLIKSGVGLIHGNLSDYGKSANLEVIKKFLLKHAEEAKAKKQRLVIYVGSWSRGAVTADDIFKLAAELGIEIDKIHNDRVDPVVGSWSDKFEMIIKTLLSATPSYEKLKANSTDCIYMADEGGLNIVDNLMDFISSRASSYLPPQIARFFSDWNLNLFSGLMPVLRSEKTKINEKEYDHKVEKILCPANHEGIVGRGRNEKEKLVGHLILADMVCHLLQLKIEVDVEWAKQALHQGLNAFCKLSDQSQSKIQYKDSRTFVDLKKTLTMNASSLWHPSEIKEALWDVLWGRKLEANEVSRLIDDEAKIEGNHSLSVRMQEALTQLSHIPSLSPTELRNNTMQRV